MEALCWLSMCHSTTRQPGEAEPASVSSGDPASLCRVRVPGSRGHFRGMLSPFCLLGGLGSWHKPQERGHRRWQSCRCCDRLWNVSTKQVSLYTGGWQWDLKRRMGPAWIPLMHTKYCLNKEAVTAAVERWHPGSGGFSLPLYPVLIPSSEHKGTAEEYEAEFVYKAVLACTCIWLQICIYKCFHFPPLQ